MKIRHLKITFEKRRKLNLLLALPTPLLVTQFKIKILMLSICEPCISFGWKPTPIPGFPGCMALVVASLSAFVRASCCSWQSPGRILSGQVPRFDLIVSHGLRPSNLLPQILAEGIVLILVPSRVHDGCRVLSSGRCIWQHVEGLLDA